MLCDCVAAGSSSVDQRWALSSSAIGPRVRDSLCLLEGLGNAGMEVEGGAGNSQGGAGPQGWTVQPSAQRLAGSGEALIAGRSLS